MCHHFQDLKWALMEVMTAFWVVGPLSCLTTGAREVGVEMSLCWVHSVCLVHTSLSWLELRTICCLALGPGKGLPNNLAGERGSILST